MDSAKRRQPAAIWRHQPPRAVLLDCFGTLVTMEAPAPMLCRELGRSGVNVSLERAEEAFAAEIAYYVEHHMEGHDERSLDDLRKRCAEVLRRSLNEPALDLATTLSAMLAAIRFRPYPDATPALADLRERGLKLVVASNWDCSLHEVIAAAGLSPLLDGVVASAEAGAAKPSSAIFARALELTAFSAREAVYVGDSLQTDIEGARSAGLDAVLLSRDSVADRGTVDGSVAEINTLTELASVIFGVARS